MKNTGRNFFHSPEKRGYGYVCAAALLWALSGTSAKFLFNTGVTPFQLVQLRLTIASAVLLLWMGVRHPALLVIARKDIAYFALFGFIGMAGVQFTYLFAISKIQVGAAILLQYLAPVFIVLYTIFILKETPGFYTISALVGALGGCYLVSGAYSMDMLSMHWIGIVSGLLSAIAFAWYSIHGEYGMRRYDPWTVLFYALFFGSIAWNLFYPPLGGFFQPYLPLQWGWIVFIGILGTLIPFGLYLEGINLIRSTRASIAATLEPISASLMSYIFLDEALAPPQIAGAVLVIAAIITLQLKGQSDAKAPALIRAKREKRQTRKR